jgi:hypothetical protein
MFTLLHIAEIVLATAGAISMPYLAAQPGCETKADN